MTDADAETIATQALEWLSKNDELLSVFAGSTGIDQSGIGADTPSRDLMAAVLGFLTMDDRWVIEFCDHQGLKYETPILALSQLNGEGGRHWT